MYKIIPIEGNCNRFPLFSPLLNAKNGDSKLFIPLPMNMIISNNTIFQADYECIPAWRGSNDGANVEENHRVIIPKEFEGDVKALCDYAGITELNRGMAIRMTLQEILAIIPKARTRIESYKLLIKFLNDEMGVALELTSRKSK